MAASLSNEEIESHLFHSLQQVSGALDLRLHIFSSPFQAHALRRTILITQPTPPGQLSNPERKPSIAVIGLSAIEYSAEFEIRANRSLVYLQYIDTTGAFAPRAIQKEVTKALILGYLRSCQISKFSRCHIFAKSNPHYLFANSEANPAKRVLSDSQLISWWAKTLSGFSSFPSHFLIAGDEDSSSEARKLKSLLTGTWIYGFPSPRTQRAIDVIPVFPDDQKAVQLRKLIKEENLGTDVGEFFQRLSFAQSSRQAFFSLGLMEVADHETAEEEEAVKLLGKGTSVDLVSEVFERYPFGSTEEATASTPGLLDELRGTQGVQHFYFDFKKEAVKEKVSTEETPKEKVTRPPPVNNLQGLIKRKKVEPAGNGGK